MAEEESRAPVRSSLNKNLLDTISKSAVPGCQLRWLDVRQAAQSSAIYVQEENTGVKKTGRLRLGECFVKVRPRHVVNLPQFGQLTTRLVIYGPIVGSLHAP